MNAKTPNSDRKLIEALRQSPEIQKIEAEENARSVAERQKMIAAIAAMDAKADRDFPALDKAEKVAIAGLREAEKDLRAANDRLRAASYAKSGASLAYTTERRRLEELLHDGADGELFDSFRREMLDEIDKSRKQFDGGSVRVQDRVTRRLEERGYNNMASVNARLAAINSAMEEAERLRISADQKPVAARLAELRASLPKIEPAVMPVVGGKA